MCTEINNNFTDTDVTETRRLGEAKENATGPRPVLITLTHIDKKRTLLRRFHHIRENDKFKNIKIDHDKTKQEREESKKLYEEAKRQEAADKSGEYLYRVRGPSWERKIRKKEKPVKTTPRVTYGKTNVNKNNLNDIGNILCFYTNADQLRNKQNEFEQRIKELKPHIIAINEVKPKNPKCTVTIPEFYLEGYTLFSKNIENNEGRGIIIYVLNSLYAENINLVSTFKECLFIEIKLKNKTKLLFGCIYRSDGGSEENNAELLNMIRSTSGLKYSHIVLTGDFNLPDINWKHWTTKSINPSNLNFKFVECLKDTFMYQHVSNPTRG